MAPCGSLCRVCAGEVDGDKNDDNSLFIGRSAYVNKIKTYFRVELYSNDKIPKYICDNCVFELDNIEYFRERCLQTQKTFSILYNEHHFKVVEDDKIEKNATKEIELDKQANSKKPTSQASKKPTSQPSETSKTVKELEEVEQIVIDDESESEKENVDTSEEIDVNENVKFEVDDDDDDDDEDDEEEMEEEVEEVEEEVEEDDDDNNEQSNANEIGANCHVKSELGFNIKKEDTVELLSRENLTVDLVKTVKREKLDFLEELSTQNRREGTRFVSVHTLMASDEVIIGSQLDNDLFKAINQNESLKPSSMGGNLHESNVKLLNESSSSSNNYSNMNKICYNVNDVNSHNTYSNSNDVELVSISEEPKNTAPITGSIDLKVKKNESNNRYNLRNSIPDVITKTISDTNRITNENSKSLVADYIINRGLPVSHLIELKKVDSSRNYKTDPMANNVSMPASSYLKKIAVNHNLQSQSSVVIVPNELSRKRHGDNRHKVVVDLSDNIIDDPNYDPNYDQTGRCKDVGKHMCPVCDLPFRSIASVRSHMQVHTTKRNRFY